MQVPGQVVPELNDSSCRDRGAGETRERQATSRVLRRRTAAAGAALVEPREEVGSRFAGERKRLMYDRRKKERS